MSDDWDRFVRIIRADGTERTLPFAAWTEDLERRCLEAGCRIVKPEESAPELAMLPQPRAPLSQRDEDLALVQELLDAEDGLTPWEIDFSDSLWRWLKSHDTLTEKQREKAEQIARELP